MKANFEKIEILSTTRKFIWVTSQINRKLKINYIFSLVNELMYIISFIDQIFFISEDLD